MMTNQDFAPAFPISFATCFQYDDANVKSSSKYLKVGHDDAA